MSAQVILPHHLSHSNPTSVQARKKSGKENKEKGEKGTQPQYTAVDTSAFHEPMTTLCGPGLRPVYTLDSMTGNS